MVGHLQPVLTYEFIIIYDTATPNNSLSPYKSRLISTFRYCEFSSSYQSKIIQQFVTCSVIILLKCINNHNVNGVAAHQTVRHWTKVQQRGVINCRRTHAQWRHLVYQVFYSRCLEALIYIQQSYLLSTVSLFQTQGVTHSNTVAHSILILKEQIQEEI